ncbi:gas vesicle accessory protein GvpU [Sutcliffiella rhizosphaerae]|uniref:Gas vesicle protein GvpU n=1 Tax=Sutcliffiella rhizosphaerae TaxID=2880967 RepID=A0ABM8YLR6_9BACI|nr:gas vesicle accessory protein GvpU [Sutcliffiella rhizosphaerae]CAG9620908.1 hypothetical protein BACCIP111883_01680 [Sutcliffiella rhizosphaerae]
MTKKEDNTATDDAVLQMFLDLTNDDGCEIDLTLNIYGVVVAGTLVGPQAYYEGIVDATKNIQNKTLSQILHKKFSDLQNAYIKEMQELKEKDKNEFVASYIHLKNATYLVNQNQNSPSNGMWWRGKIDSIDGISFKL